MSAGAKPKSGLAPGGPISLLPLGGAAAEGFCEGDACAVPPPDAPARPAAAAGQPDRQAQQQAARAPGDPDEDTTRRR